MSSIEISRSHRLGKQKARTAADRLVGELAAEFEVDYAWQGDHLHFERPGVSGTIEVGANAIHIHVDLGLFLFALKSPIENEIHRYLNQHFA